MAAVYFENPNIITEEDVISIDKKGIKYTRGYIDFSECAANFSRLHEHKTTVCVADRDSSGTNKCFDFYTTGNVTRLLFTRKFRPIKWLFKPNADARFLAFQKKLTALGWSTYDLT